MMPLACSGLVEADDGDHQDDDNDDNVRKCSESYCSTVDQQK